MMCVRCGKSPRDTNVLLCRDCRYSEDTMQEVREAMARKGGLRVQRAFLAAEHGWYGHWRTPRAADAPQA